MFALGRLDQWRKCDEGSLSQTAQVTKLPLTAYSAPRYCRHRGTTGEGFSDRNRGISTYTTLLLLGRAREIPAHRFRQEGLPLPRGPELGQAGGKKRDERWLGRSSSGEEAPQPSYMSIRAGCSGVRTGWQ